MHVDVHVHVHVHVYTYICVCMYMYGRVPAVDEEGGILCGVSFVHLPAWREGGREETHHQRT